MNVGLFSYLFAFVAYFILTALLIFSWRGRQLGTLMILASALTAVWAGISASLTVLPSIPYEIVQIAELARDAGWCIVLLKIISQETGETKPQGNRYNWSTLFALTIIFAFTLLAVGPIASRYITFPEFFQKDAVLITWVALSVIGMLLIEQIFRNANPGERWSIKYLCLGIGGIFAYDFFMFSDALLFKQLNSQLWNARGIVNGMMVPLIAVSVARNPNWALNIHVSRHVVFHSATLMGAGIYLLIMASVGYFIRFYGGTWGGVLQIAFLSGTGLLLVILLFSDKIRAKIRVLLSKHFFSYKYDYREEWLRFTQTLAESGESIPDRVIRAMAALVKSPGAILWVKNENSHYELLAHWNMPEPDPTAGSSMKSLTAFIEKSQWLIDLDEYDQEPGIYDGLDLPAWIDSIPKAWLIVPLLFKSEVLGLLLVKRSEIQKSINWEERDLLKMAGQQAASHLAQYMADQALMQARQFEAFNRLSAYIVHDLKNILAQQSLIISNAEKHRHNPKFIDDVIHTVENSVGRMTRLMEQMRSGMRGTNSGQVELLPLLSKVIERRSGQQPIPIFDSIENNLVVNADKEQLGTVFGHIIQNAQEATQSNGQVIVRLAHNSDQAIIEVEDSGSGMDAEFIQNRLFKPFDSTKGLTGMGIGVFESREFIRSLGGNIYVKSTPGEGSLFRIILPCEACTAD